MLCEIEENISMRQHVLDSEVCGYGDAVMLTLPSVTDHCTSVHEQYNRLISDCLSFCVCQYSNLKVTETPVDKYDAIDHTRGS